MNRRPDRQRLGELGPILTRIGAGASLAILAVLVILIIARSGGGTYEVTAVFDDVRGVIPGAFVTAGFQNVGTVEDVWLADDGYPHVRMQIDDSFQLHQGAFANIRTVSNVGAVNRVVDLTQGNTGAPELPDGATLGPSHTDQPVDLDVATSTLDPRTRRNAAALLAGLDEATQGTGNDFNRTLRHSSTALNETANLLGQVNYDDAAIQSLVTNAGTVVRALAANSSELGATAERTATLLNTAAGRQLELRRSIQLLGPALGAATGTLNRLSSSVPSLRELVAGARPLVDALGPVTQQLPPASSALESVLGVTRRLVEASPDQLRTLQPALDRTLPIVNLLAPSTAQLNPFLNYLRVRIPDITSFFQLSGDATADYDANGNLIRSTVPLLQVNRHPNVISPNDATVPGRLAPPFIRTPGSLEGDPWTSYCDSFIGGGSCPSASGAVP